MYIFRYYIALSIFFIYTHHAESFVLPYSRLQQGISSHRPLSPAAVLPSPQLHIHNDKVSFLPTRSAIFRLYGRKKKSDLEADPDEPFRDFDDGLSKPKKKTTKKSTPKDKPPKEKSASPDVAIPRAEKRHLTANAKSLDFTLDDELNDALQSIESGKFDLDEFLLKEGDTDMLLEDNIMGVGSRRKTAKDNKAPIKPDLANKKYDDIDELDEEDMEDIDDSLAGIVDDDDDMMLDMVAGEEEDAFDMFDDEEDELESPRPSKILSNTTSTSRSTVPKSRMENITFPDDDDMEELDDPSKPLIIDGIQLDRKVG